MTRKPISNVKVNELFSYFSYEYGYDPNDYTNELARLIYIWEEQGYIEVYNILKDRVYSRIKSSEIDGNGYFIYQYCELYHARIIDNDHDPLLVIKFIQELESPQQEYVSIRFISDHKQLFGTIQEKSNKNVLNIIRDRVDDKIQQGNKAE